LKARGVVQYLPLYVVRENNCVVGGFSAIVQKRGAGRTSVAP